MSTNRIFTRIGRTVATEVIFLVAAVFRRFRRFIKPYVLLLNAWRFKQSEENLAYLNGQREDATAKLHREHVRQVRLQARRAQIAQW